MGTEHHEFIRYRWITPRYEGENVSHAPERLKKCACVASWFKMNCVQIVRQVRAGSPATPAPSFTAFERIIGERDNMSLRVDCGHTRESSFTLLLPGMQS
jgi:hypothetical protein